MPSTQLDVVTPPELEVDRQLSLLPVLFAVEGFGQITPVSFDITDPSISIETACRIAAVLGVAHKAMCWALGDLINFSSKVYGERYAQVAAETDLRETTLMNYSYVCGRIPKSRRRVELPFSSHALVAPLEPKQQQKWLDKAVAEGWSRSQFDRELKKELNPGGDDGDEAAGGEGGEKLTKQQQLESACKLVWHKAQRDGEVYRVPAEAMAQLAAALGYDS